MIIILFVNLIFFLVSKISYQWCAIWRGNKSQSMTYINTSFKSIGESREQFKNNFKYYNSVIYEIGTRNIQCIMYDLFFFLFQVTHKLRRLL